MEVGRKYKRSESFKFDELRTARLDHATSDAVSVQTTRNTAPEKGFL